ncbi:MAG: hypothetical protein JO363_02835 [Solirubrobacterales bacterium]|nr:hypothetical protein [Solirubrobacterales bacterium]
MSSSAGNGGASNATWDLSLTIEALVDTDVRLRYQRVANIHVAGRPPSSGPHP